MKERLSRTAALSLVFYLVDYSLRSCSPAELLSASSTVQKYKQFSIRRNFIQNSTINFVHYTEKRCIFAEGTVCFTNVEIVWRQWSM